MPQRINESPRTRAIELVKQAYGNAFDQRKNSGVEDNSARVYEGLRTRCTIEAENDQASRESSVSASRLPVRGERHAARFASVIMAIVAIVSAISVAIVG